MTFDDFKTLCDGVAANGTIVTAPCPIVIGDGDTLAQYGELNRPLVVLRQAVDTVAMLEILRSCTFSYSSMDNSTVIEKRPNG